MVHIILYSFSFRFASVKYQSCKSSAFYTNPCDFICRKWAYLIIVIHNTPPLCSFTDKKDRPHKQPVSFDLN